MLTTKLVSALVVLGLIASLSSAAIIADYTDPTDSYTIAEVIQAKGIIVGDKLFDEFRVTDSNSQFAVAPGAGAIKVTGILVGGDYGLRFNGPWSATAGQLADSTIAFRVSIIEPDLSEGWLIKDNALWITAFGVSNTVQGGIVSVSEQVYASDPAAGFTEPIANKAVYYVDDTNKWLYDEKDFVDASGAPLELPEVWVIKDVIANGGYGETGIAHLSEFYQTFSQIPEPGAMALLGLGGLAMLIRRRRG